MVYIIIFEILSLAIILFTISKLIKNKNLFYIIEIGIESIGLISNSIYMFAGRPAPDIINAINIILSIVIPISLYILERKGLSLGELLYVARANADKENFENILIDALEHYPNSILIHNKFAKFYIEKGAIGDAEEEYLKLIELEPNNTQNYIEIANLYRQNRNFDDAIEALNIIYKQDENNLEIAKLLGDTYYDAERYNEALGIYSNALKNHPESFELYYAIGMTYTMLNDFNTAKEYYSKAARINSYRDVANLNLGQIMIILGEYDNATKYFEQVIKSDDDKIAANGYYNLARIKIICGELNLAIKYSNLAIELDPKMKKKILNDSRFEVIFDKLNIEKPKTIFTRTTEKERKIINYLNRNFTVNNDSRKENKIEKPDREIDY